MTGIGFSEFLILCVIGLIVLGPKRLPQVASQIGSWVGQARRMTRVMKRQLEEELEANEFDIKPTIDAVTKPIQEVKEAFEHSLPNDDDTYSPLHDQPEPSLKAATVADADDEERDEFDVEPDFDDEKHRDAGDEQDADDDEHEHLDAAEQDTDDDDPRREA